MSVLFVTITDTCISMCSDRQATHQLTGEVKRDDFKKIAKWSPEIGIGCVGSEVLCDLILSTVRSFLEANGGLNSYTLEEIADNVCQAYYAVWDEYEDMPDDTLAKIVVAGKLSSGKLGAILNTVSNNRAETDTYEAKESPVVLILEPTDVSAGECNQLFRKAIENTKSKNKQHEDIIETVHRKAVRYVSERSEFVGHKSDYLVIRPDPAT